MVVRIPYNIHMCNHVGRHVCWLSRVYGLLTARLKMLNVMVEVDHRKVLRVLRALPTRWRVDANGDIDRRGAQHRAAARVDAYIQRRLNRPTTTDAEIARLEADANYFWEPTESEWNQVADLLGVPVADLKASQHRPV